MSFKKQPNWVYGYCYPPPPPQRNYSFHLVHFHAIFCCCSLQIRLLWWMTAWRAAMDTSVGQHISSHTCLSSVQWFFLQIFALALLQQEPPLQLVTQKWQQSPGSQWILTRWDACLLWPMKNPQRSFTSRRQFKGEFSVVRKSRGQTLSQGCQCGRSGSGDLWTESSWVWVLIPSKAQWHALVPPVILPNSHWTVVKSAPLSLSRNKWDASYLFQTERFFVNASSCFCWARLCCLTWESDNNGCVKQMILSLGTHPTDCVSWTTFADVEDKTKVPSTNIWTQYCWSVIFFKRDNTIWPWIQQPPWKRCLFQNISSTEQKHRTNFHQHVAHQIMSNYLEHPLGKFALMVMCSFLCGSKKKHRVLLLHKENRQRLLQWNKLCLTTTWKRKWKLLQTRDVLSEADLHWIHRLDASPDKSPEFQLWKPPTHAHKQRKKLWKQDKCHVSSS